MHLYGFDSHKSLEAWALATFLWRKNGKNNNDCSDIWKGRGSLSDTRKEELSRALISITQKLEWLLRKGLWFYLCHLGSFSTRDVLQLRVAHWNICQESTHIRREKAEPSWPAAPAFLSLAKQTLHFQSGQFSSEVENTGIRHKTTKKTKNVNLLLLVTWRRISARCETDEWASKGSIVTRRCCFVRVGVGVGGGVNNAGHYSPLLVVIATDRGISRWHWIGGFV